MVQARKIASALEVAERWPAGHVEIVPITTKMKLVDKNTGQETIKDVTASEDERRVVLDGLAMRDEDRRRIAQHEEAVAAAGYEVQESRLWFMDFAECCADDAECHGNNPATPYGSYDLAPAPDQPAQQFVYGIDNGSMLPAFYTFEDVVATLHRPSNVDDPEALRAVLTALAPSPRRCRWCCPSTRERGRRPSSSGSAPSWSRCSPWSRSATGRCSRSRMEARSC